MRIYFRVLSQELSCSASTDRSVLQHHQRCSMKKGVLFYTEHLWTIALFLNCQLKTLEIFFIKVLLNPLLPNVPF